MTAPLLAPEQSEMLAAAHRRQRAALLRAVALGFAGGCLLIAGGDGLLAAAGTLSGAAAAAVAVPRRPRRPVGRLALGLAAVAGLLAGLVRAEGARPAAPPSVAGAVAFVAEVAEPPVAAGAVSRLQLTIDSASAAGLAGLRINATSPGAFQLGDQVSGTARLSAGRLSGVRLELVARDPGFVVAVVQAARGWLLRGLHRALPPPESSVAGGLVLGERQGLPAGVASDFQASGLVHLLVTSGLKVSLVGALAGAALRQAAPRAALGTAAAGMAAFAIVGGGSAAALRATLAGGTGMLAAATGRPAGALGTLPLVSAAMLALDPASAGSIGFQLTCAGTAGIALLPRELPGSAVIPRWMSEPALYTVAAGLATLPLVLDVFHIVSLWGPVANVLVLPLLPVAFIALLAGGGLAAALPGLAPVISVPAWLLVNWIETVAHITASLPLQLHAQHVEAPWVFLYYALLGSLAMAWRAHPR